MSSPIVTSPLMSPVLSRTASPLILPVSPKNYGHASPQLLSSTSSISLLSLSVSGYTDDEVNSPTSLHRGRGSISTATAATQSPLQSNYASQSRLSHYFKSGAVGVMPGTRRSSFNIPPDSPHLNPVSLCNSPSKMSLSGGLSSPHASQSPLGFTPLSGLSQPISIPQQSSSSSILSPKLNPAATPGDEPPMTPMVLED